MSTNQYGFSNENVDPVKLQFPVAENVNGVELESCSYCEGPNWEGVDITLRKVEPTGVAIIRDREFCVNEENIRPSTAIPNDTVHAAKDRAYKKFNGKLKLIAQSFGITESQLMDACKDCSTPKEFVEAYCNLMNSHATGKAFVKTTLDNGYVKLARYNASSPMIQPMVGQCSLRYTQRERDHISQQMSGSSKIEATDEWI